MPVDSILVRIFGRHSLLNEALAASITNLPKIEVVRMAAENDEIFFPSTSFSKELAVWVLLPSEEDLLFEWLLEHPQSRVLLFSLGWVLAEIKTALRKGVAGCIFSNASLQELAEAIRQVARGDNYLPASLIQSIILDEINEHEEVNTFQFEILSPREQELIPLLCQGLSNKQIAQKLYLSVRTIENHLSNIYKKLNVNSRTEVAVLSMQMGWVS